jgi:hypothetical protein
MKLTLICISFVTGKEVLRNAIMTLELHCKQVRSTSVLHLYIIFCQFLRIHRVPRVDRREPSVPSNNSSDA